MQGNDLKKIIALISAAIIVCACFVGCGSNRKDEKMIIYMEADAPAGENNTAENEVRAFSWK